jgi:hypothetical protein
LRLWTVHPKYLDARGLVAAWREALLAQKVLQGRTRGYLHHPQLIRFRTQRRPVDSIAALLRGLAREAFRRGYRFDRARIAGSTRVAKIDETEGQLLHEWRRLRAKLRKRAPRDYRETAGIARPDPHPLFRVVPGGVRDWEKRPGARRPPRQRRVRPKPTVNSPKGR